MITIPADAFSARSDQKRVSRDGMSLAPSDHEKESNFMKKVIVLSFGVFMCVGVQVAFSANVDVSPSVVATIEKSLNDAKDKCSCGGTPEACCAACPETCPPLKAAAELGLSVVQGDEGQAWKVIPAKH